MKIHSPFGDLPFKTLYFPDGQLHVEILLRQREGDTCCIEEAISTSGDLMRVLLTKDALDSLGYITSLDIRYLLGGRMDRRMAVGQPFTLQVVARMIMQAGFSRVRILDPHSPVSCTLTGGTPLLPRRQVDLLLRQYPPTSTVIIAPDAGATRRVRDLLGYPNHKYRIVQGHKVRNPSDGTLHGFEIEDASAVKGKTCLILDDICDGGRTFTGMAKVLTQAEGGVVDLFVTHGIFSNDLPIEGIHHVFSTNSYREFLPSSSSLTILPIDLSKEST